MIFAKEKFELSNAVKLIKSKLEITELGEVKYLLGVNFEKQGNDIYLHQKTYWKMNENL